MKSAATRLSSKVKPTRDFMPRQIPPMLATLATMPQSESLYAFEYKWDGIRAICYWDGRDWKLESRNLLDITHRYPELWKMEKAFGKHRIILDGEIVALDEHAQPRFSLLQRRMHVAQVGHLAEQVPAIYMLFDILYLDGRALFDVPYEERRSILEDLGLSGPHWQTPPSYAGEGRALLSAAAQGGLEGIVAKRLTSTYEPGKRSRNWLKIKVLQRQEFVIGGWVPGEGGHQGLIGSLLLGYYDELPARGRSGTLQFAGGVGTGFDADDHHTLLKLLSTRRRPTSPFAQQIPKANAIWIKPDLVAEIEFLEWTPAGNVRHPSYQGLRPDKEAREVVRERVVETT